MTVRQRINKVALFLERPSGWVREALERAGFIEAMEKAEKLDRRRELDKDASAAYRARKKK